MQMEGKKSIIYNVTIKPAEKPALFRITWFNKEKRKKHTFDRTASDIIREEVQSQWQQLKNQLPIGKKLFRFLDGDRHCLVRALDEAAWHGESLVLYLSTCKQIADWPFELLAQESFLLPQRVHLVRCVSDWGVEKKHIPQNRPLKLLFMACSPLDVNPELDFEKEEETIFQVTDNLPINMEVDDSGSLEGLSRQLEQEEYDVIHLSGHSDIDKNGQPFFVMEDEIGKRRDVFPFELWQEALIENPPRLLFLSGCRTGETPARKQRFLMPAP